MSTLTFNQKIKPFLWFQDRAEEAAAFYCSLFEQSRMISTSDLVVEFELEGLRILALNGGPHFELTEAFSFMIVCEDQREVDHFWDNFTSDGGEESMCGWCKDKFGLSWQVIPKIFMEIMGNGSADDKKRVMEAIMTMQKMEISVIEEAIV